MELVTLHWKFKVKTKFYLSNKTTFIISTSSGHFDTWVRICVNCDNWQARGNLEEGQNKNAPPQAVGTGSRPDM